MLPSDSTELQLAKPGSQLHTFQTATLKETIDLTQILPTAPTRIFFLLQDWIPNPTLHLYVMFLNLRSDSSLIVSLSFVILTLLKSAGQWLCRQLFWLCLFLGLWVFDQNTTEVILHFSQCIQARSSGCWYDFLGMLTLLLGLCWVSFPWSTYFSGYYLNGCRAFYWDVYGNQILFLYI